MPKKIRIGVRKKIIKDIICEKGTKLEIAERYGVSLQWLYKMQRVDSDIFQKTMNQLKERIHASALIKAQRCLGRLRKDKIDGSSGLALTQMTKNLVDTTRQDANATPMININVPPSREALIADVLNVEVVDTNATIVNGGQ